MGQKMHVFDTHTGRCLWCEVEDDDVEAIEPCEYAPDSAPDWEPDEDEAGW